MEETIERRNVLEGRGKGDQVGKQGNDGGGEGNRS